MASELSIEDIEINSWTQPMHLFIDGSTEAVCGIRLDDANDQNDREGFDSRKFPASNNYDSVAALREHWENDDSGVCCSGCYAVFDDRGDTDAGD